MAEQMVDSRKVQIVVPEEGMFYTYANNVSLGYTAYDVRITFGEITDVTPDTIILQNRVQVTMSWLEAKQLSNFLKGLIEQYETKNASLEFPQVDIVPIG